MPLLININACTILQHCMKRSSNMIGKYIFQFIFIISLYSAANAESNFPTDALCRNPGEYFSQSTAINPYIIFHLEEYTLKHISKTEQIHR